MITFGVIMAVVVASWGTGFGMAFFAENDRRQSFGQDIMMLVLASLLGGVAGYFTGRSGK